MRVRPAWLTVACMYTDMCTGSIMLWLCLHPGSSPCDTASQTFFALFARFCNAGRQPRRQARTAASAGCTYVLLFAQAPLHATAKWPTRRGATAVNAAGRGTPCTLHALMLINAVGPSCYIASTASAASAGRSCACCMPCAQCVVDGLKHACTLLNTQAGECRTFSDVPKYPTNAMPPTADKKQCVSAHDQCSFAEFLVKCAAAADIAR
jgi:hypothetical protein